VPEPAQGDTKVVLLGTGTPNAEPERSGPATGIVVGDAAYLVDAGPGVVRRAAAAHRAGIGALDPARLTRAFITHLHSDHTVGLPDLILTSWTIGRTEPLRIFGPVGVRSMTENLFAAYEHDIRERLEGLEPANGSGCEVRATEIEPGRVYEDARVTVDAFAANHGSWPAFGFRFTTPDRVVVVSGDTAPFDDMVRAYADCDVLVHEAHSEVGWARRDPAWRAYHRAVHTSTAELAEVASIVRPGLLVLTHALTHGAVTDEELLDEVHTGYDGPVVLGRDLDIY